MVYIGFSDVYDYFKSVVPFNTDCGCVKLECFTAALAQILGVLKLSPISI